MLERSDRPIEEVIKFLADRGVEAAYLVPTETGLEKSILDAHASVREYFKEKGLHDYHTQAQGQDAKRMVKTWLVGEEGLIETQSSLYRPETKSGDPRIWIYGLKEYVKAWNLLALLVFNGELYVTNVSRKEIFKHNDWNSPFGQLLDKVGSFLDPISQELLDKLREIAQRGFINSLRAGTTGVGMTLETLLGIAANSRKEPDYKGIEIKASRIGETGRHSSRTNLLSKVPDWNLSRLKSPEEILAQYGYTDKTTGRRQLYCTVSNKPNPQGLYLTIDDSLGRLDNLHSKGQEIEKVVCWQLEALKEQIAQKHRQTFWVKANTRKDAGGEQFHYIKVVRTQSPLVANLPPLFDIGAITMDYTLSLIPRSSGKGERARDHGYLFKIHPNNFNLLFPPPREYDLI